MNYRVCGSVCLIHWHCISYKLCRILMKFRLERCVRCAYHISLDSNKDNLIFSLIMCLCRGYPLLVSYQPQALCYHSGPFLLVIWCGLNLQCSFWNNQVENMSILLNNDLINISAAFESVGGMMSDVNIQIKSEEAKVKENVMKLDKYLIKSVLNGLFLLDE